MVQLTDTVQDTTPVSESVWYCKRCDENFVHTSNRCPLHQCFCKWVSDVVSVNTDEVEPVVPAHRKGVSIALNFKQLIDNAYDFDNEQWPIVLDMMKNAGPSKSLAGEGWTFSDRSNIQLSWDFDDKERGYFLMAKVNERR